MRSSAQRTAEPRGASTADMNLLARLLWGVGQRFVFAVRQADFYSQWNFALDDRRKEASSPVSGHEI